MAVAASVKTIITIKGNDQASKSIKKSTTAMGKLQTSMGKASAKSRALGSSLRNIGSGNITGALSDVGGLLGGGSGGIAAAAAAATVATAALAVGIAAAAFKTAQWAEEIERMRVQFNNAFGPDGVQKALAFADAIGGVTAENVGKLASTIKETGITAKFTVAQLQELGNRAAKAGKTGDEALEGLNRALQTGTTRALKQVGVFINSGRVLDEYAASVGTTTTKLTDLQKQSAVADAITKELSRTTDSATTAHHDLDSVLARVTNTMLRFKLAVSDVVGGDSAKLVNRILDLLDATARWSKVLLNVVAAGLFPFIAGTKAALFAITGLFDAFQEFAKSGASAKVGDIIKQTGIDIAKSLDPTKAWRDAITAANEAMSATPPDLGKGVLQVNDTLRTAKGLLDGAVGGVKSLYDQTVSGADAAAAAAKSVVSALGKGMDKATERRRLKSIKNLKKARSNAATARMIEERALDDLIDSGDAAVEGQIVKNAERAKAHVQAVNGIITAENQLAQARAANDPLTLARMQNLQTQFELEQRVAEIKASTLLSESEQQRTIDAVRGIAHEKQMARLTEATNAERAANQARIQGALAIAQAGVGLLKAVDANARVVAGIQMALATAQAFLSFAMGDYVGAIAAATAAVNFGKIAFSSPDQPPSLSSSSAAASASPGIAAPASSGGGGSSSFNITINGVFATAAETGAALKQAIGAASATGMQGT